MRKSSILTCMLNAFLSSSDSVLSFFSPSCLRICLSGMGRSGSSNRPYVLSEKDFAYHFAQIANAHTGNKKAKLCLYEHESHRPRIEWLKQMTKLVFGGDYDHKRYQVRQMHFDGNRLIEANSVSPTDVSPPPLVSLLECDEELSDEDDHESVAHTIVQENMHDINQQHPSSAHTHDSTSNDEDAHTEDESRSASLAASTRLASLPLPPPPSTSSTGLPLASPACSPSSVSHLQLLPFPSNFNLFAADSFVPQSNSSACLSRAPSTSSIAYMKLPSSFPVRLSSNELFTEPTLLIDSNNSSTAVTLDKFPSTVERTHSEARLDSTAFQWLHANSNGVQMATSMTSTSVPQPSSSTLSTHLSIPVQVQLAPSCSPFLSPVAMQRFSSIDSIGQFLVDEGSRAAYEQQITNA